MGPTPAIAERSSRQLLPTNCPSDSATTQQQAGVAKHHGQKFRRNVHGGKVRRKCVLGGNLLKGFVADGTANVRVLGSRLAYGYGCAAQRRLAQGCHRHPDLVEGKGTASAGEFSSWGQTSWIYAALLWQ
jgi:hypothetical protein